jgi:hypothetical protein
MIPYRIESPKMVIHRITKNPNRLVSPCLHRCEDGSHIFPIEAPDLIILIDHLVVPIGKKILQRIQIKGHPKKG